MVLYAMVIYVGVWKDDKNYGQDYLTCMGPHDKFLYENIVVTKEDILPRDWIYDQYA